MKVYFNTNGTIKNIPTDDTRFFQNSGNDQELILYGIPEGEDVMVTFTRSDRVKYGPYLADYDYDDNEVLVVKLLMPPEAFEVAGGVRISILAQHEAEEEIGGIMTTKLVRHAYAKVGITVYENDAVVVL